MISATGTAEEIFRAFSFICDKLREAALADQPPPDASAPEVSLRLAIPNTQAGAIIGKAGAKIKEIRDATGSSINMDKEVLPGSTERACSLSGTTVAVSQAIFHISCTMIQVRCTSSIALALPTAILVGVPMCDTMCGWTRSRTVTLAIRSDGVSLRMWLRRNRCPSEGRTPLTTRGQALHQWRPLAGELCGSPLCHLDSLLVHITLAGRGRLCALDSC